MKQQKGLGRGLDAIFGAERIEVEKPKIKPMSEMAQIAVDKIMPNPTQPRREFNEEALQELAESIRTLGVIQPVTLKAEGNKYIIISGERRWRAAQIAKIDTLPAYVREVDDQTLHAMALVENIQREDLNPIEIALGMQRLIDECNLTQEAMAEQVSMKRSTVSNYMRLLKLPVAVQLALKSGVITMGHAKAIAGVDPQNQLSLLKKCAAKELSVRQCEELARRLNEKADDSANEGTTEEEYPDSYLRLAEQLERFFTQNISIKRSKKGGGKITIDFDNDADIDTFIKRFESK